MFYQTYAADYYLFFFHEIVTYFQGFFCILVPFFSEFLFCAAQKKNAFSVKKDSKLATFLFEESL